jgi:hypothetical protein
MAAARARTTDVTPKQGFDAYAGMLALSLIAMLIATVFLIMDYSQYEGKPTLPTLTRGGGGSTTPAPGGPGPGGAGAGGGVAPAGPAGGVPPAGGAGPGAGGAPGGAPPTAPAKQ